MVLKKTFALTLLILYSLLVLYLSFGTFETSGKFNIPYLDKLVHLCMYMGWVILALWYRELSTNKPHVLPTFFIVLIFGIVIEAVQETINPLRTFDIWDMFCNVLGVCFGAWIYSSKCMTLLKKLI